MGTHYINSRYKRFFDLTTAFVALVILSPLFILLPIIILIESGSPIFFKQKRVGKNKKIFTIYKFRTMKQGSNTLQNKLARFNEAPQPMFKIKNDPRFTKIGKALSKTGLDEIPQLLNIFKGEMSIIGPRPLPVSEAQKLDSTWNFRYKVNPGVLSEWALSPKRHRSLKDWKFLELQTIQKSNIYNDIIVMLKTIRMLFKQ